MCTNIAIATDLRLRENDAKLPDPGARSNACSLRLRRRVDLFPLCLVRGDCYELISRSQIECLSSSQSMLLCPVDAITVGIRLPIKRCLPGAKREHRWISGLHELP